MSVWCEQCSGFFVNPSGRLVLKAECSNCASDVSYKWSIYAAESTVIGCDFNHQCQNSSSLSETNSVERNPNSGSSEILSTRVELAGDNIIDFNRTTLVLEADVLPHNERFRFEVEVLEEGTGRRGSESYEVYTNGAPTGGTCSVSSTFGYELDTLFTVSCHNWTDEQRPLEYRVFYELDSLKEDGEVQRIGKTQIYGGLSPSFKFCLPAGNARVTVHVRDSFGVTTYLCPIELEIDSCSQPSEIVEEMLYDSVHSSSGTLARFVRSGNCHQVMQYIRSVGTVLNRLNETISTRSLETRTGVRSRFVDQLHKIDIISENVAVEVASSLLITVMAEKELVQSSICQTTNVLSQIASKRELGSDMLLSPFVSVTAIVLSVHHHNGSSVLQQEVNRALEATRFVMNTALMSRVAGEEIESSVGGRIEVVGLKSSHVSNVPNQGGITENHATFWLPEEIRTADCYQSVMMAFENNPYMDSPGQLTMTKVSSLDLASCDAETIVVEQLKEPLMIDLPNFSMSNETIDFTQSYNITTGVLNEHIIQTQTILIGHGLHVRIDLATDVIDWTHTSHMLKVVVKENATGASLAEIAIALSAGMPGLTFVPSSIIDLSSRLVVAIAVESASEMTEGTTGEMVSVAYRLLTWWSGCNFWNETEEQWSTNGCYSVMSSSPALIRCRCSHLSSFAGSVAYAPNGLSPTDIELITELPRNPVVFSLVVAVVVVYLTAVILLRWQDNKDQSRIKLIDLPDNNPEYKQCYEILIETGMQHGGGTTARVNVVLFGDQGVSETRELWATKERLFEANSQSSFLLNLPNALGMVNQVDIWHDNGGSSPSWFLNYVAVRNLQTGESWEFPCYSWLSVEHGDGSVKHRLVVVKQETLTYSKRLIGYLKHRYADHHLWYSLFRHHVASGFTRVQRMTCLMSVVLCAMCANAAWFEANGEEITFQLFNVSLQSVYVGVVSSLVVFPINFIWIVIFRMSQEGMSKCDRTNSTAAASQPLSSLRPGQKRMWVDLFLHRSVGSEMGSSSVDASARRLHIRTSRLPHWMVYVAWCGCLLTVAVSGTLTVLYGLTFGEKQSTRWVGALFFSLLESLFITQPLLVVAFAVFAAMLLPYQRRPLRHAATVDSTLHRHQLTPVNCEDTMDEETKMTSLRRERQLKFSAFPADYELFEAVYEANITRAAWKVFGRTFYHVLVFWIVAAIVYTRYAPVTSVKDAVDMTWKKPSFEHIRQIDEWWAWVQDLLPLRTGRLSENHLFLAPFQLRQLRVKEIPCADDRSDRRNLCFPPYSDDVETGLFLPVYDPSLNQSLHWNYTELSGWFGTILGHVASYPPIGGFVVKVDGCEICQVHQLKQLQSNMWIDRATRLITLETIIYSPSANVFSHVRFVAELLTVGSVVASAEVTSSTLVYHRSTSDIFLTLMEFILVIVMMYRTGSAFCNLKIVCWKEFNWVAVLCETALVVLVFVTAGFSIYRFVIVKQLLDTYTDSKVVLIGDWITAIHLDRSVTILAALVLFLASLMLLHIVKLHPVPLSCLLSIHRALSHIFHWVLVMVIMLTAFSCLGCLVLGQDLREFSSFSSAFVTLFSVTIRVFDTEPVLLKSPVASLVYFSLFEILVTLMTFAMCFAILRHSLVETKEMACQQNSSLWWQLWKQFALWSRLHDVFPSWSSERQPMIQWTRPKSVNSWEDLAAVDLDEVEVVDICLTDDRSDRQRQPEPSKELYYQTDQVLDIVTQIAKKLEAECEQIAPLEREETAQSTSVQINDISSEREAQTDDNGIIELV